jgi:hypothetical protein
MDGRDFVGDDQFGLVRLLAGFSPSLRACSTALRFTHQHARISKQLLLLSTQDHTTALLNSLRGPGNGHRGWSPSESAYTDASCKFPRLAIMVHNTLHISNAGSTDTIRWKQSQRLRTKYLRCMGASCRRAHRISITPEKPIPRMMALREHSCPCWC